MVSYAVKVVDKNDGKPVAGATVTARQDVWFGDTKQTESKTDNNGTVFFDGDTFTTYQISASKNLSNDSGVVRINVFDTTPETLTLELYFEPTKGIENTLNVFGGEVVKNTRTLSIGFAVVGSAVVVLYLLNKAKSSTVPTVKVPKVNLR